MQHKKIATDGQSVANGRESSGGDLSSSSISPFPSSLQSPLEQIEILDMQRFANRGAVKAVCRVRLGAIVINGYRVVVPVLASRPFVSPPSRKIGDDWEPFVSVLSPTLSEQITTAVLSAYRGAK